jgi:hypothetical protein
LMTKVRLGGTPILASTVPSRERHAAPSKTPWPSPQTAPTSPTRAKAAFLKSLADEKAHVCNISSQVKLLLSP